MAGGSARFETVDQPGQFLVGIILDLDPPPFLPRVDPHSSSQHFEEVVFNGSEMNIVRQRRRSYLACNSGGLAETGDQRLGVQYSTVMEHKSIVRGSTTEPLSADIMEKVLTSHLELPPGAAIADIGFML